MTRDEILAIAREAGGNRVLNAMVFDCDAMLERFAILIAERTHTNRKAEWYGEGYEAGRKHERDTIIAKNRWEIERINDYIKTLEEAARTK